MRRSVLIVLTLSLCSIFGEAWTFYSSSNKDICDGKLDGFHCNSCLELLWCPFGVTLPCANHDERYPFCLEDNKVVGNATCSSKNTCPGESTSKPIEKCERVDLFPDSIACDVYHVCSEIGKPSIKYGCSPGSQFDPIGRTCYTPAKNDVNCHTFLASDKNGLCRNRPLVTLVHPLRPDVFCICDGNYKLQVCKSANQVYNSKKRRCEFRCPRPGFFEDPDNEGNFITCTENRSIYFSQPCGPGLKFDENVKHCRPESTQSTTEPPEGSSIQSSLSTDITSSISSSAPYSSSSTETTPT